MERFTPKRLTEISRFQLTESDIHYLNDSSQGCLNDLLRCSNHFLNYTTNSDPFLQKLKYAYSRWLINSACDVNEVNNSGSSDSSEAILKFIAESYERCHYPFVKLRSCLMLSKERFSLTRTATSVFGTQSKNIDFEDLLRLCTPNYSWVEKLLLSTGRESKRLSEVLHLSTVNFILNEETSLEKTKVHLVKHAENCTVSYFESFPNTEIKSEPINSLNGKFKSALFVQDISLSSISLVVRDKWTDVTSGGTPLPLRQSVPSTARSWAVNPQFLLSVQSATRGKIEIRILLSQESSDAEYEEIFVTVLKKVTAEPVLTEFNEELIVDGGVSYLRKGLSVYNTVYLPIAGDYFIVPSTWAIGITKSFMIDLHVMNEEGNISSAKLKRVN